MAKKTYGYLKGKIPVYLLEKSTAALKLKKDKVVIQDLRTGDTGIAKRKDIKRKTTNFSKMKGF